MTDGRTVTQLWGSSGDLGQAIYNNVQLGLYSRRSALILLVYALVLTSDWIEERPRSRVAWKTGDKSESRFENDASR